MKAKLYNDKNYIIDVDIDMDNFNESVIKFADPIFIFTNMSREEASAHSIDICDNMSIDDILSQNILVINYKDDSFSIEDIYKMYKQITNKKLNYLIL